MLCYVMLPEDELLTATFASFVSVKMHSFIMFIVVNSVAEAAGQFSHRLLNLQKILNVKTSKFLWTNCTLSAEKDIFPTQLESCL